MQEEGVCVLMLLVGVHSTGLSKIEKHSEEKGRQRHV